MDKKIKPCPWCMKEAKIYLEGSYVSGWEAFVECSDLLYCGARGPSKRTSAMSNEEHIAEDQAIEAWNKIIGGS
jgi:hypothetical protein